MSRSRTKMFVETFAHPCSCRLLSETTPPQHTCPRTTCTVMAKAVEWKATPARVGRQGKRKAKSPQKKNPEVVRVVYAGEGWWAQQCMGEPLVGPLVNEAKHVFRKCTQATPTSQKKLLSARRLVMLPPFGRDAKDSRETVCDGLRLNSGHLHPSWWNVTNGAELLATSSCGHHTQKVSGLLCLSPPGAVDGSFASCPPNWPNVLAQVSSKRYATHIRRSQMTDWRHCVCLCSWESPTTL